MIRYLLICSDHSKEVREANLLKSDLFKSEHCAYPGPMLTMDYGNIPKSLNEAIVKILAELPMNTLDFLIFTHEDVIYSPQFESQILTAIDSLPMDWAVCGVAGARIVKGGREFLGNIKDRGMEFGRNFIEPQRSDTVDELCIIVNTEWLGKDGLMFDEKFPLDFYGADICMQAHQKGLGVYTIPGYCAHNSTRKIGGRTTEFYTAQEAFRLKWKQAAILTTKRKSVATTCAVIDLT